MRSRSVIRIVGILLLSISAMATTPTHAWSIDGHQLITKHAIEMLPPPWKQFFEYYNWFLAEATAYPDIYYREMDPNEGPRHYVDLEVWNPIDPSTGTLPQSVVSFALDMQTALEAKNWNNALLLAGRVAHYVEDDTQPYHTTVNYNPTNKMGTPLHSVLDSSLVGHLSEITFTSNVEGLSPIDNLTAFTLNLAYESHSFLPIINRTLIDEGFDWSPELTKIIENRTNTAIIAVARVWITAIMTAEASAPDIPVNNQLSITIENVSQTDNGLTSIQLQVTDSLGVRTYADVTLTTDESTYRGQVANVVPPVGEYVIVFRTGLHPDIKLNAQREGYNPVVVGVGNVITQVALTSITSSRGSSSLLIPMISDVSLMTIVALVVIFCCFLALLILRKVPAAY